MIDPIDIPTHRWYPENPEYAALEIDNADDIERRIDEYRERLRERKEEDADNVHPL